MKACPLALAGLLAGSFLSPCHAAPVVHWKLDESSGTTAADSSGNLVDGIWRGTVGSPAWMPGGGIDGGAFQFTGANSDMFYTDAFGALAGLPFTISAWVNTASTENDGLVYVGNGTQGAQYYVLRLTGNVARVNARNTTEVAGIGTTPINDSQWHHLVAIYAGDSERRLFVDGALQVTETTFVNPVTLNRFGIGALTRSNPADFYTGFMDDVSLWNRVLTEIDIAALRGLGTLGAGNAEDLDPLVNAFAIQGSAPVRGRQWEYATGLAGPLGATGGSVASLNAFIVLDNAGNGMRMAAMGNPVLASFTATPSSIYPGGNATLDWEVADADSVSIDQMIGTVANPSGSMMVSPLVTTTYTITAMNASGSVSGSVTVTVVPEPVIRSFTAAPLALYAGESTMLSWNVENFDSLMIDGGVGVVTDPTGSVMVTPASTTTYTLTGMNTNATVTASVNVIVFNRTGPVLHWPLDETGGTTADDLTGNGFEGAWQGNVGVPDWRPGEGIDGGAFAFTGANLDSFIAENFIAVAGTPFTMSAWIKTTSVENDGLCYLGNGAFGDRYYVLRLTVGIARVSGRNVTEIQGLSTTPIGDDGWHSLVAVYAGDADRRIYIDGRLEGTNTTLIPAVVPSRFGIGALTRNTPYNPADLYAGLMDDAALWARPFTAADAAALHGLGVLGAGNASDLDPFVNAFTAQGTTDLDGYRWGYTTGLEGALGTVGGSLATLDGFIVLDDTGNGMRISGGGGLAFTAVSRNPDASVVLTWRSRTGVHYKIDYSTDLVTWLEINDSYPSAGESTKFTYSSPNDPDPATAPLLYFRVTEVP